MYVNIVKKCVNMAILSLVGSFYHNVSLLAEMAELEIKTEMFEELGSCAMQCTYNIIISIQEEGMECM